MSAEMLQYRTDCQEFAALHLAECCAELIEWKDTAILRDGRVRDLSVLCAKFIARHDCLAVAESFINRAAMNSVVAVCAEPAAQASAAPTIKQSLMVAVAPPRQAGLSDAEIKEIPAKIGMLVSFDGKYMRSVGTHGGMTVEDGILFADACIEAASPYIYNDTLEQIAKIADSEARWFKGEIDDNSTIENLRENYRAKQLAYEYIAAITRGLKKGTP